ncbi:MAG: hypothetical protein WC435_00785 [Candidatus Paceibacterota bacterium]
MISKKELEKYKAIYRKHYSKEISDQEALEQGIKLIRLIELVYKPITKDEYKKLQKRRRETGGVAKCNWFF